MREDGIGRVLVASLHQGIADILPSRLGFYENWLHAKGLRDGTIGLAPFYAVVSFLRQEGAAYDLITTRAGEYAADWTIQGMTTVRRVAMRNAPAWLRTRMVLGVARRLVHSSYVGSRAVSRIRRGTARIDLRGSIFCTVREPVAHPLCGYYAAAITRLLTEFRLPIRAQVVSCRGTGETSCVLHVVLTQEVVVQDIGEAA